MTQFLKTVTRVLNIRTKQGLVFMGIDQLCFIKSNGKKSLVYSTEQGSPVIANGLLKDFEKQLPMNLFFRCHQSYIINIYTVKSFNYYERTVTLDNNEIIPVSRARFQKLKKLLLGKIPVDKKVMSS